MLKVNYHHYNQQYAVSYVVYMMAGSLFHKCGCKNSRLIQRFYLHYVEMKDQLQAEDDVLSALGALDAHFLTALAGLNCEVSFAKEGSTFRIRFETDGFESLEAAVAPDGTYTIRPLPA